MPGKSVGNFVSFFGDIKNHGNFNLFIGISLIMPMITFFKKRFAVISGYNDNGIFKTAGFFHIVKNISYKRIAKKKRV